MSWIPFGGLFHAGLYPEATESYGTVVLFMHGGVLQIFAVAATVFGVSVPAQQILQQIGSASGQDPSNINVGFVVDRLFTCKGLLIIDGHTGS
jgi:hypothetical protein